MEVAVTTLSQKDAGKIELAASVFEQPVRKDILHQVVVWQLAKQRQGTHSGKTRGEVKATTKKMYKQKGTGRARHGSADVAQFRGGGQAFARKPRDYSHDLPKKVRKLGLKAALSAKLKEGKLVVLDEAVLGEPKTKQLAESVTKHGWGRTTLIAGAEIDGNFKLAARNLAGLKVLPSVGANVYDILHGDTLVLTKSAVVDLEERLA
ncbi:MAG: 50S ribosomal protein L4 [Geminicoccaceae bacterium]